MPEAVIVDAVRTPIGRAIKGSLKDVRADDLAAVPLKALQERNPQVDFAQTNDIMWGAAAQEGEQGYNVGRIAALLAGIDDTVPAVTLNRFCSSSLQSIRMAFHAIKAGEGDQYIAGGSRRSRARRAARFRSTRSSTAGPSRRTTSTSRWA
jgi:acetyl-CoA C-acetyltransferase